MTQYKALYMLLNMVFYSVVVSNIFDYFNNFILKPSVAIKVVLFLLDILCLIGDSIHESGIHVT